MIWTHQTLEEANGELVYFPSSGKSCLLSKTRKGWKLGINQRFQSAQMVLRFLNQNQATISRKQKQVIRGTK